MHKTNGAARDCGAFFLDVAGRFAPQEMIVQWRDRRRASNAEIDRLIEQTWADETEQARSDKRKLFDGPLCRLIDCDIAAGKLSLTLGPVSFKDFLGTNLLNPQVRDAHGVDVLGDAVGVSGNVVSSDGLLIMGHRSERVAFHAGRIHPIGGMLEPLPPPTATCDPFAGILQELSEEIGVGADAVREIVCLGLMRDKQILQPELIFELTVDADAETLRSAAAIAPDAEEHTQLVTIRDEPAAVVSFIERDYELLAPVATGTLLLHGLLNWGEKWFNSMQENLCAR
ncbi:MAG: hypothetical protein ACYSTL_05540 [Planctomycetota bacterium]